MNRAERRRQEKAAKKLAKASPRLVLAIVEKHWRDVWRFDAFGLTVQTKTGRVIASCAV